MSQSTPSSTTGEGITADASIEPRNEALNNQDKSANNEESTNGASTNTEQNVKSVSNPTKNTDSVVKSTLTQAPRRNRPGTKGEDYNQWRECTFEEIKSPLALQEYLQELLRIDRSNIDRLLQMPPGQNEDIWQYEHLRMLCMDINYLVIQLESECTKESCPEMKADEWLFLCAAHLQPQACCAIDYAFHTLDGATSLLNSHKYFPSRQSIMSSSLKHFQSIARRLYRIFAHAWYHHREEFNSFESESYLYSRFVAFSRKYHLIPDSLMVIPEPAHQSANTANTRLLHPPSAAAR
ncbi:Mob1/phocein [Syncephalis plumigaleata]|nr:Mob1/phocein [Syncephalis plumigaleata]